MVGRSNPELLQKIEKKGFIQVNQFEAESDSERAEITSVLKQKNATKTLKPYCNNKCVVISFFGLLLFMTITIAFLWIMLNGEKSRQDRIEEKFDRIEKSKTESLKEINAIIQEIREDQANILMQMKTELRTELKELSEKIQENIPSTFNSSQYMQKNLELSTDKTEISGQKEVMYYTFYSSGMEEFVKINDCTNHVHLERYEMKSITRTDYRKENWTFIQDEKRKHWMQMASKLNPNGINVFTDADIVFLKDPTASVREFCTEDVSILMATDIYTDKASLSGGFVIVCKFHDLISEEWAGPMNDNKYDREQLFIDYLGRKYPKNILRLPGDVVVGGANLEKVTSKDAFAFHTNWCEDMKCKEEKLHHVIFDMTQIQSLRDCYNEVHSESIQ